MASTQQSPSAATSSGRGGRGAAEDDDDSTLAPVRDAGELRRSSRVRSAGLALLWLVVVAGAVGLLGVHSSTTRASGSGYRAELTYASIARPGWDVPWHLVVTHPGGFGEGTVTVAVSRSMFDIYETQGFHPEPDSETADGQYLYLEFAPPPGDTLVVDFDAYIQPTSQLGRRTTVKVVTGGQERLRLHTRTFLLP